MTQTAVAERADQAPANLDAPTPTGAGALTTREMAFQLIQGGADLGSVKEFLAMSKELAAEEARRAFEVAVSDAKAEIPVIQKNRHVGFDSRKAGAARTDYWHEDFAQIARTVDPILSKHGLSYRHEAEQDAAMLSVTCILSHRGGHSTRTTLKAGNDASGNKNAIQAVGSTATFLQRYTLKLALGLAASKDEDGRSSNDDTGLITEDQVEELKTLIGKAVQARPDTDEAAWLTSFLEYMKVDGLIEIRAEDFNKAKTSIDNAIRQGSK